MALGFFQSGNFLISPPLPSHPPQDLKPPNFLIDELDHCVVADFGISKIVHGTFGAHMPSNVGLVVVVVVW